VVTIAPIQLDGSPLVADLAELLELPPRDRIGSVRSEFTVGKGRIATDRLSINVGPVPILLAGWTDFDGHIDYQVNQNAVVRKLPQKARSLLADLQLDLDQLVALRVQGTLENLTVRVEGTPGDQDPSRQADDRKRLRELGRRLRDRILK
jgi:AsmA protein